MPRLLNTSLFNVHDIIVIGAIAVIAHYTMLPLYNMVANKVTA